MKASVTAPGSLLMASAVTLALTPRPLTMSAMRGASGLPGMIFTGCAKASAGRMPSAAILGMGPCGVISTNFWSGDWPSCPPAGFPSAGITNVLAGPGLAVDDGDRFGVGGGAWAGIARISFRRRHCDYHRTTARTVVAAGPRRHRVGFRRARHRGFLWRHRRVQIDRNGHHGFAAERIVAQDRPKDKNTEEDRENCADDLRQRA